MLVHTPSHQQLSHTGSVTVDLLRRRTIAWFLSKFQHCTETGLGEAEVCPVALFPGKCPPSWMRTLRKLYLSSLNNLSFNSWPQVWYVFHLLLMLPTKYRTGTSTTLLRATFPLCDYYTLQGEVRMLQKEMLMVICSLWGLYCSSYCWRWCNCWGGRWKCWKVEKGLLHLLMYLMRIIVFFF